MKFAVKKIYCPTCEKLVCTREENTTSGVRITCLNCKNAIWVKENLAWRYVKPE